MGTEWVKELSSVTELGRAVPLLAFDRWLLFPSSLASGPRERPLRFETLLEGRRRDPLSRLP